MKRATSGQERTEGAFVTAIRATWSLISLEMICCRSRILLVLILLAWVFDLLSHQ